MLGSAPALQPTFIRSDKSPFTAGGGGKPPPYKCPLQNDNCYL